MTSKPKGKFVPKIGQLVSWKMTYTIDEPIEYYGMITNIFTDHLVEVIFLKNGWKLNINLKDLKLINDVD